MNKLSVLLVLFLLAASVVLSGCRMVEMAKSIMKNQEDIVKGIVYSDTVVTDDGRSRLTETLE